jgi:hypothetical protein
MYRNPALRPGLVALVAWLLEQRYSSHAIGRIERYVAVHGTLAGSLIEPEDEAAAEEAFVEALDAVPSDSDAWDRPDAFLDVESLLDPRSAVGVEPPAGDRSIPPDAAIVPPELDDDLPCVTPISGGAPEPFQPSPEDWEDYHRWSEDLGRQRDAREGRTGRHSPEALARINRALYGREEPFHA